MSSEEHGVVWVLQGFSKVDEFLRTEFPIRREQILRLREVIRPDADDPWMHLGYNVPIENWPAVDAILQCGPPDPGLDYQTGTYSSE
ncbi:DUF7683 domain-containing protein [Streptomyces sp. NPDC055721]|uniref:DUF7683 domain-containing protein n=1 Tax=Streptomyces sp. NPDC127132 TaxID=3345374 RepID=UPI003627318E